MRPTRTSTFLRNNWLLILLIVVGLLWWRVYDLFTPPLLGWKPDLQDINYWSIITNPNLYWAASTGYVVLGILTVVYILRSFAQKYRLILIAGTSLLCVMSICSTIFIFEEGRTVKHLMSIQYENKVYHLALSQYIEFLEASFLDYYVFECESSGYECSKISEVGSIWVDNPAGKLVVSENSLFFENWNNRVRILPSQ